jgi:hypothetical protein
MKHLVGTAALLAAMTSACFADGPDIRACDFEVKARCVSGDARVTLVDGAVKRLEINVIWCGPRGQPGYTCIIDSSRDDRDSKWSDDGGATSVANASPWNPAQPDRVKVTVGRAVSIDFDEAQSLGRCGAGAALPRAIVIPAPRAIPAPKTASGQKNACRVWLAEP